MPFRLRSPFCSLTMGKALDPDPVSPGPVLCRTSIDVIFPWSNVTILSRQFCLLVVD